MEYQKRMWQGDLIRVFLACTLLVSFRFADPILLSCGFEGHGYYQVFSYWLIFTWLIEKQIFRFRSSIREMLIKRILNEDFWLARWLQRKIFLRVIGWVVSSMIAVALMSFVYTSSMITLILLALDILIFVFLDRFIQINFSKVFQTDIANLFHEFSPTILNVMILSGLFMIIVVVDRSAIFPLTSADIPHHVADTVTHSCKFFRYFARTGYFLDLNIRSLQTIPGYGWYIYLTMLLTSMSLVPFVATSLIYKSSLHAFRFSVTKK